MHIPLHGGRCLAPLAPTAGMVPLGAELRALVRLALPVSLSRAGLLLMTTIDTVMVGWAGPDQLAYLAIGLSPFVLLMLMGVATLTGTVVLVAQAHGAGELREAGRIWQHALLQALVLGGLSILVLSRTELLFRLTGQTPAITAGGAEVAFWLGLGMPGMLGFLATTLYLEALGRARPGVVVMLAGNLANIPLNQVLINGLLGLPAMGAAGAAFATSLVRWAMLAALAGYVLLAPSLRATGVRAPPRWSRAIQMRLLRLGMPFAISQGLETSAFQSVTLICGWLGPTALAAFQIALNVTALIYMATVGLATATAVRVGRSIGGGDTSTARLAAWLGLGVLLAVMLTLAPLLLAYAPAIARLYTQDAAVAELTIRCLALVAVIIIFDGGQGVLTGALRGAADVWRPMQIHVASFWLILLPASWLLAFPLRQGVIGLFGGILLGVGAAACLLLARLIRLPWEAVARL